MNREVLERWCERGILALVMVILVLGPLALGAVGTIPFLIIQVLTLLATLLWLGRLWFSPKPQLLWPPICWAVLLFALYAVARYLTADIEYIARQELLRVLVYAFLFLIIINNLRRQESTQIFSFTMVFLAMGISFYALYQFVTGSDHVWQYVTDFKHRGVGTYFCPNHTAGFLEMILPLAVAYTICGRVKPVTRVLLGYAALVIVAGIGVTVSRGGWASTAIALVALVVVLLFYRAYRLQAFLGIAVLVGLSIYVVPKSYSIMVRFKALEAEKGSFNRDTRMELWKPALQIWQDNFWWGAGPAHYDERFRAYRPQTVQLSPYRAHNDYLNTLADWGLVGTVVVLSAWILLGLGIAKTWRTVGSAPAEFTANNGSNRFAFVLGASLGLLAILCHSTVDFNMHIPANAILAVSLMALLSAQLRFATESYWFSARLPTRALLTGSLVFGAVYLGQQAWLHGSEFVWLDRAERAPDFSQQKVKLLEHAFAIDPMNGQAAFTIGEALERQSREGGEHYQGLEGTDYRKLAEEAMTWLERAMKLNRWYPSAPMLYGRCLDWLGRYDESPHYFDLAERLDPNNYFTLDHIGLHYVELGNFAAAKPWFERSVRLEGEYNSIGRSYLDIIENRLMDSATNDISARLNLARPH